MRFQTWIQSTKDLMDLIRLIPADYPEMIQDYTSYVFSIRYDPITKSTKFKRSVPAPVETHTVSTSSTSNTATIGISTVTGNMVINGPLTVQAPLYNPHTIVPSNTGTTQNSDKLRLNVSITVRDGELIDVKFINKNMNSFQFSTENTEDGGIIEHTMLYIGSDKMIHNGVLYDLNSPDAFTHDISTDTDVSIMDLFYLKEYYETYGRP